MFKILQPKIGIPDISNGNNQMGGDEDSPVIFTIEKM